MLICINECWSFTFKNIVQYLLKWSILQAIQPSQKKNKLAILGVWVFKKARRGDMDVVPLLNLAKFIFYLAPPLLKKENAAKGWWWLARGLGSSPVLWGTDGGKQPGIGPWGGHCCQSQGKNFTFLILLDSPRLARDWLAPHHD